MDRPRRPAPIGRRVFRAGALAAAGLVGTTAAFAILTAGIATWFEHAAAEGVSRPEGQPQARVEVAVPEVYELANIALALTEFTDRNRHTVFRRGAYYDDVMRQFGPYREHPLIVKLNAELRGDRAWNGYYSFRENSVSYEFASGKLQRSSDYPSPIWRPNGFDAHRKLVEQFAAASGFRKFFDAHREWYAGRVVAYRDRVPLARMLSWLDARFPSRYDRNRVVFSPLIYGSHSTQRFAGQTIMFVAGPDVARDTLPMERQNADLARIVFTEIDHNYVNPTSDRYRRRIDQAFADIPRWQRDTQSGMYASAYATFNEYMTWGVFLLYGRDTYDPATAAWLRADVIRMMEGQRGFIRFGEFMSVLEQASDTDLNPDRAYDAVLTWAARR